MRKALFAVLLVAWTASANEVGISSQGLELTFFGLNTLKLQLVGRLGVDANFDNDNVAVPTQFRASARWLRLGSADLTLNFLSGFYLEGDLADDNNAIQQMGVTIVEFEPVIELTTKFNVFANATLASFDTESEELHLGVFSTVPSYRLGLRAEL